MPATKYKSTGWKGVDTIFKNRVQSPPGTDAVQSAISIITYTVVESVGPQQGVQTGSGSLAVGSSIYNSLQPPSIDPSWTEDNTGYNFAGALPGSCFPDAGEYSVVFMLTPSTGGTPFPVYFTHHANSIK